ncbi:ABC transporter ATP-binding protein [Vibrio rumoiensis]|uniref:ABC transporter ATP-binding protein n=1 Tax=Vibrio rumoiensis TaxID=76258 RepID=A0ABW7IZF9_9VIBR
MTAFLEVQNLTIKHGDIELVSNLSFCLANQTPLVVLGQTGSGKSLLLKFIMGTLEPTLSVMGKLFIQGKEIHWQQRKQLWGKTLSILPQEPFQALSPLMRSQQQVCEVFRYVQGKPKSQAKQESLYSLNQYGLGEHAQKRPYELSGGMAQRLAMSVARASNSDLFLADEPTKGLDVSRRDDMVDHLKDRAEQGGLLVVTHDIDVARGIDGQMIVLQNGQLIEQGNTRDMLTNAQHPYTQTLISSQPEAWQAVSLMNKIQEPILKVSNLSLRRGKQTLIDDLNFQLHAGEVIGVVGDSGCGKSSLGDAILGQLPIHSGSIEYLTKQKPNNKVMAHQSKWLKLFQDPIASLPSHATLGQLLKDLVKLHKIDTDQIPSMMETLRLKPEILNQKPHQASGGELQRFAILRTLLLKPVFLFADEPTTRLDPIVAKEVSTMLITLAKQQGCGMLIVSHDPQLIKAVSDKVIQL